jgi:hypothetical protein
MTEPTEIEKVTIESPNALFWAVRGNAIQAYANVEYSLCSLLSVFGNIESDVASIIFYKVTSSRARDSILEKLLKKRFGTKYSVFWNSVAKLVGQITEVRNQIVHWQAIDNQTDKEMQLVPPTFIRMTWGTFPLMRTVDLSAFITKCDFVYRLCNIFWIFLTPLVAGRWAAVDIQTWADVFQQPIVYPPATDLPPSPTMQEPKT